MICKTCGNELNTISSFAHDLVAGFGAMVGPLSAEKRLWDEDRRRADAAANAAVEAKIAHENKENWSSVVQLGVGVNRLGRGVDTSHLDMSGTPDNKGSVPGHFNDETTLPASLGLPAEFVYFCSILCTIVLCCPSVVRDALWRHVSQKILSRKRNRRLGTSCPRRSHRIADEKIPHNILKTPSQQNRALQLATDKIYPHDYALGDEVIKYPSLNAFRKTLWFLLLLLISLGVPLLLWCIVHPMLVRMIWGEDAKEGEFDGYGVFCAIFVLGVVGLAVGLTFALELSYVRYVVYDPANWDWRLLQNSNYVEGGLAWAGNRLAYPRHGFRPVSDQCLSPMSYVTRRICGVHLSSCCCMSDLHSHVDNCGVSTTCRILVTVSFRICTVLTE